MVTVSSGRHRRFEDEPFGTAEYLQAPVGAGNPEAARPGAWGPGPAEALGPQAYDRYDFPPENGQQAGAVPGWPPDSLWNFLATVGRATPRAVPRSPFGPGTARTCTHVARTRHARTRHARQLWTDGWATGGTDGWTGSAAAAATGRARADERQAPGQ